MIYFSGVPLVVKEQIISILNFKMGDLPVKYLGLPLFSTRLKKEHCHVLIDRISARVLNWAAKSLSYAGRLQLINSVLNSMHVYWSSVFLLPLAVVHEVEKICRSFCWHGSGDCKRGGLIKWSVVCKSKSNGGLGVKPLQLWNLAAIAKHIWEIVQENETLWSIWVIQNKLKRLSFWGIAA
ncbi:RNA-directed DNA polymerase protein [Dioscorea alata]|uniref:RNA-directed DNA polymerase protein n=1 Tax=Dioscorea alata TaxID=55571 RepID=A0ACB7UGM3_DIOAL|nr:RNA-directed DNA polymerase protein [Dioscorea alata]